LCVGKEWHRFPSSFYIPERAIDSSGMEKRIEMRFLMSEFRGILPKPFEQGSIPEVTSRILTDMNDENREEVSRYVPLSSCDFVIDLDTGDYTEREPNLTKQVSLLLKYESFKFSA
jgi:alpha-1,2-mannosyltransferase